MQAIVPGEHYIRSDSGAFYGGSKLCWRCAWYLFGREGVLPEPAEPEPGTLQKIACGRGGWPRPTIPSGDSPAVR